MAYNFDFCDTCETRTVDFSEAQLAEAKRQASFSYEEELRIQNGTYNRFVDGAYFHSADTPELSQAQHSAIRTCVNCNLAGTCVVLKENLDGEDI